jgi:hypothetical protein
MNAPAAPSCSSPTQKSRPASSTKDATASSRERSAFRRESSFSSLLITLIAIGAVARGVQSAGAKVREVQSSPTLGDALIGGAIVKQSVLGIAGATSQDTSFCALVVFAVLARTAGPVLGGTYRGVRAHGADSAPQCVDDTGALAELTSRDARRRHLVRTSLQPDDERRRPGHILGVACSSIGTIGRVCPPTAMRLRMSRRQTKWSCAGRHESCARGGSPRSGSRVHGTLGWRPIVSRADAATTPMKRPWLTRSEPPPSSSGRSSTRTRRSKRTPAASEARPWPERKGVRDPVAGLAH